MPCRDKLAEKGGVVLVRTDPHRYEIAERRLTAPANREGVRRCRYVGGAPRTASDM